MIVLVAAALIMIAVAILVPPMRTMSELRLRVFSQNSVSKKREKKLGLPKNILISSEETALYLAKKFGVPDNLIRDADERQQLVQMAQQMQQMQQQGELPNAATLGG